MTPEQKEYRELLLKAWRESDGNEFLGLLTANTRDKGFIGSLIDNHAATVFPSEDHILAVQAASAFLRQ